MRRAVPEFRLPRDVLDEEIGFIMSMGLKTKLSTEVKALSPLLSEFAAVFVGIGAPSGRNLPLLGYKEAEDHIHIGLDWLAGVSFEQIKSIGENVVVIGGGNTAMDCCRTALRLGAKKVTVVAPEGFDEMLASPWEKSDALHEGVEICNHYLPREYLASNSSLKGIRFDHLASLKDTEGTLVTRQIR